MRMEWITDWSRIILDEKYLVCPINAREDKTLYLAQPIGFKNGWEVVRLMEGCYTALLTPKWDGIIRRSTAHVPAHEDNRGGD